MTSKNTPYPKASPKPGSSPGTTGKTVPVADRGKEGQEARDEAGVRLAGIHDGLKK